MGKAYALLRAGFPYVKTLGMRRITSNPIDLALGQEGRLYVLGRGALATEIRRTSWDDEDLGTIGGPGTTEGKFLWPGAILADAHERLYVSDEGCHRISVFAPDGAFLSKWGEHGSAPGQLNRPSGMAFDAAGHLYVVDTMNHRVQQFTRQGKVLLQWGSFGTGEGQFNMPWGIAVDDEGEVYVADWRNDRIQKFRADGTFIGMFGSSGQGDGQFNRPTGVTVDMHGDIYVADWGNNRVQLFNPEGRYVQKFLGDATLSRCALAYVMANPKPLRLREMANLEPQKLFHGPVSVRVDTLGRMFVADCGPHRIQVYQKEAYPLTPPQIIPPLRAPSMSVA
ncbi:MAG: NHL repeat-containing protein [Candidatus Tectimicrobiota bacterium]